MTAISPSNLELYYENRHYGSDEEYLLALGEAMRVEYLAITDAGFVLQIDDPRMATHYNRQRRFLDRGLPQVHRAARRDAQPRTARHPGRHDPLPHLLQHQHRAARARFRAQAFRRPDAEGPRRRLSSSKRQIRATSMNGRSGGRSSCRTTSS